MVELSIFKKVVLIMWSRATMKMNGYSYHEEPTNERMIFGFLSLGPKALQSHQLLKVRTPFELQQANTERVQAAQTKILVRC
jgi:hypothetical protein